MDKKILITGGGHSEIPLIQAAKKLNMYVITTGKNLDGLGHKLADKYVPGDFSDKEFIYQLAKKEQVDSIVSGCNDFAYLSTAYACERMGLFGHDSYQIAKVIHHKDKFRMLTKDLDIRTPNMFRCFNEEEVLQACRKLKFPIVVKPVDLTGGKGVTICQTKQEILPAYQYALKCSKKIVVILEEYIIGDNHGISTLLKNQKVVFWFCDNEQYYHNKYLVAGASSPSTVPQCAIFEIIQNIEKIAKKLKLSDGLFHSQFILEKGIFPVLIDPCRRTPGDLYVKFVEYVTGVDYSIEIIKAECGQEIHNSYELEFNCIARECIMSEKKGIVEDIIISSKIKEHILDSLIFGKRGELIENISTYKAGILFLKFNNWNEMEQIVREFHNNVTIKVQDAK